MSWDYSFTDEALRQFRKFDHRAQAAVIRYLDERIATTEDPRRFGKPLTGDLFGFWRYRVADYRLICRIDRGRLLVLVVKVGHRSKVYD